MSNSFLKLSFGSFAGYTLSRSCRKLTAVGNLCLNLQVYLTSHVMSQTSIHFQMLTEVGRFLHKLEIFAQIATAHLHIVEPTHKLRI